MNFRNLMVAAGAVIFLPMSQAAATRVLLEQFNYSAGALTGQTNPNVSGTWALTGANNATPIQVSAGSLAYSGLTNINGGKVTLSMVTSGEDPGLELGANSISLAASGSAFYSLVVNVTADFPAPTGGEYFAHISPSGNGTTTFRARLYARRGSVAGTTVFGISTAGASTAAVFDAVDRPNGTPVLLVVAYDAIVPSASNDTARLWVNPTVGDLVAPAATATSTDVSATELTSAARFNLRQSANGGTIEIDSVRVGSSYASVVEAAVPVSLSEFSAE